MCLAALLRDQVPPGQFLELLPFAFPDLLEFLDFVRVLVGQVNGFRAILVQVVELPLFLSVIGDEFPVPDADGPIVFVQPPQVIMHDTIDPP